MAKTGPKRRTRAQLILHFSNKSRVVGECALWQGPKYQNGYGMTCFNAKPAYVHRISYEHYNNVELTSRDVIRHTCDTPNCWNPKHLLRGAHADNVNDKVAKKRHCFGENHHLSKLTVVQALEIRESPLNSGELSRMYGVSRASIRQIQKGTSWKSA